LLPAFRLDQLLKTLGGPFCHNATITRVKPPLRGHCSCPQRNEHLFIEPVYTDTRPAMIESTFSVCVRGCVCECVWKPSAKVGTHGLMGGGICSTIICKIRDIRLLDAWLPPLKALQKILYSYFRVIKEIPIRKNMEPFLVETLNSIDFLSTLA